MAYREKPDLFGGPPTPEERRQQRYLLWLLPIFFLSPNIGRLANAFGFKPSYELLLGGTIAMGLVCVIGAILSYRSARAMAAQDLAELNDTKRR